ncbi:hypothetical protein ARMA_2396 [Ardenticatena maritima]|uniref:Uncharacterized protein n=1 Tax=Ardenticatena maritima TaxID=872965 RepID=A0A0M8K8H2_9CHLR|nr:hypothetical protein ARMA_2396 [Ardenticatena maritima]
MARALPMQKARTRRAGNKKGSCSGACEGGETVYPLRIEYG